MAESIQHHSIPSEIWDFVPADDESEEVHERSAEEAALHLDVRRSAAELEVVGRSEDEVSSVADDEEPEFPSPARRVADRVEADSEPDVAEVLVVQHYLSS